MNDALLIYPRLGAMDSMVVDLPLSILYAAAEAVKLGFAVELLDLRCHAGDWRDLLHQRMQAQPRLVGLSVMTGMPIKNAREVSWFVRRHYPEVPIVWGGPHGTVLPETVQEPFIDFLVRGDGSMALARLIQRLREGEGQFADIPGLSFKTADGQVVHVPRADSFERIHHRDIPYHLLEVNAPSYQRTYMGKRLWPIFTAVGCPYKCTFCVSPTVYREIRGKKWLPNPVEEVIDHLVLLQERYGVTHFSVIDDTSFVNLPRMRTLFEKILERNLQVTIEFRGARVNEIDKMDDAFLELMVRVGGRSLMVGVESASDRLLRSMSKMITREQILRVNRKLARHPEITAHYNFIYGTPGETWEDLLATKETVLQLLAENPRAYFGFGSDWKAIPGSEMLVLAEREYGYQAPRTLDDWIQMDSSDASSKIVHPWYTPRHNGLIKLMQLASFVIDDKIIRETAAIQTPTFRVLRLLARLYKPIALFRLRHNLVAGMVEYRLWQWTIRLLNLLSHRAAPRG